MITPSKVVGTVRSTSPDWYGASHRTPQPDQPACTNNDQRFARPPPRDPKLHSHSDLRCLRVFSWGGSILPNSISLRLFNELPAARVDGVGFALPRPKHRHRGPPASREPALPRANPPFAAGPRWRGLVKTPRPRVRQSRSAPKTWSSRADCVQHGRFVSEAAPDRCSALCFRCGRIGGQMPLQFVRHPNDSQSRVCRR